MADTIDQQLEHLAELHSAGTLSDDEFAAAKATALHPAAGATEEPGGLGPTDPVLAAPQPSIPPKLVNWLIFFAALMIGVTVTGLSSGLEWSASQAPAAPIVCPGGKLVVGYDVQYSVAAKGVDLASVCVKDGQAHQVSELWLSTVMTIEYTALACLVLFGWRWLYLRRRRQIPVVVPGQGDDANGGSSHV